jgi:hypothetical protein
MRQLYINWSVLGAEPVTVFFKPEMIGDAFGIEPFKASKVSN